eukprot:TRINITY_DN829_c0_g1_i6.p1 TRINITY_DN829_c0_g1~~TRINITY_DN829_c0_g1_i6.p1  ORF type:complete len:613 (+),score=53.27 TRINITY_DN829_c0_g1_i6:223-2061(+)
MNLSALKKWKGRRESAHIIIPHLENTITSDQRRSQSTESILIPGQRPRSHTDPLEINFAPPLFAVRISKEIDETVEQDLQPLFKELGLDIYQKDANDLIFNKDGSVSAGSPKRLIEHLADERPQDKNYLKIFLCTHRYLATSRDLFDRLVKLFLSGGLEGLEGLKEKVEEVGETSLEDYVVDQLESCKEKTSEKERSKLEKYQYMIRLRILNVFRCWIENYTADFEQNGELDEPFVDFTNYLECKGGAETDWGKYLQWLQIQATRKSDMLKTPRWLCPQPIVPSNLGASSPIIFLKIHPLEIARQLTLMEYKLYKAIKLKEYQRAAWSKDPDSCPNIQAFIKRFNQVSFWVASEIFSTPDPKNRVLLICRFIELARHLRDLNNFNGMMEIISALNSNFLQRLRQAWKVLPQKHLEIWEDLGKIVDPIQSYRNYRKILRSTKPPLIPFQGVYLTDLTFIEQNAEKTENGFHNFEKLSMISKVCLEVKRFQSVPYMLDPVNFIQDYLSNPKILSEDELWACSKLCAESYDPPPGGEVMGIFDTEIEILDSKKSTTKSSKKKEDVVTVISNPIYGVWIDFTRTKLYTHKIPPSAAGQGSTRVNRLFMSSSSGMFY